MVGASVSSVADGDALGVVPVISRTTDRIAAGGMRDEKSGGILGDRLLPRFGGRTGPRGVEAGSLLKVIFYENTVLQWRRKFGPTSIQNQKKSSQKFQPKKTYNTKNNKNNPTFPLRFRKS